MKRIVIYLVLVVGLISTSNLIAQVTAFPAPNLAICGTNDIAVFDLTITESDIIGGQDPTFLVVTFYVSQVEADNALNAIAFPESYINSTNPQIIYARLEDSTNGDFDTTSFEIFAIPAPAIFEPSPLNFCDPDNDGFGEFNLTDADLEVTGGIPQGTLVVTYHNTETDAVNGVLPLASPYLNFVPFQEFIFVRLFDQSTGCFSITTLELIVQLTPEINTVDDIILVDEDGNGIEIVDLTVRESQILNGQAAIITYHETEADAEANIAPIANPTSYINSSNPQTIYYRLENAEFCYSVGTFILILVDALIDEDPDDLFIDEGDGDGLAIFDLTVNEAQMLGSQNPAIALFTYHTTFEDSDNGVNNISTPTAYQNTTNPQTIHVRLTNNNTGFYVLTSFIIETDGVLGIEDNVSNSFKLYPNPSTGIINLQSSNLNETVELTLYNLQGQALISANKTPENGTVTIDVSSFSAGIYFVKIASEGVTVVKKIVKR